MERREEAVPLWKSEVLKLKSILLQEAYIADWVIAAAVLIVAQTVPTASLDARHRLLILNDPALSYPYKENGTVSGGVLAFLMFIVPAIFVLVGQVFPGRSTRDFHHGLLTILEACALTVSWKRWINVYAGRYRPDFLARAALYDSGGLSRTEFEDGRQSYPSGHAAYSFMGLTLSTLYVVGRLGLFSSGRGRPFGGRFQFPLFFLSLFPIMVATFTAVSRVVDYRHDFSDINLGMAIGLLCAIVSYMLNFEPLTSDRSGAPRVREGGEGGAKVEGLEGEDGGGSPVDTA